MTALSPIMAGDGCVGFILRRGPAGGVEAADREGRPIGIFPSEEKAAEAVLSAAEAKQDAG
jgi:hypothetical protein